MNFTSPWSNVWQQVKPANPADAPWEAQCWEAELAEPVVGTETGTIDSYVVYAEVQKPYPAEVNQGEPQLVLFVDNVHVLSPYQVSQQTTEVGGCNGHENAAYSGRNGRQRGSQSRGCQ